MEASLDKEGYLLELDRWDPDIAAELALREGLSLTADHWAIIDILREFYSETGVSLSMRPLVKLVAARLGSSKGNSIYLLSLFPGNPAKLAAKVAGLPRPANCL
ncbi:MAG TPA: TusE/DsrC/DsvC family sulfur relay protein [Pseudomonadales bacterium]